VVSILGRETVGATPQVSDFAGATLLSDSELVVRAREGDRRAFGTLYLRHHDAAWRVACASAAETADAEDAVAEGFTRVFAALPRFVDRELEFRPYLLACVRNAALDRLRQGRRVDLREEPPEALVPDGLPEEIILSDLERNLVGEALQSLPERWRTVLWLTEVEGMTPNEVAGVMGIKPGAVSALAFRAREGLREAYLQAHVRAEARAECRYTVDRLGPYVRGDLAERERVKVQDHLDRCPACRQRRDELADVNAALLGALLPPPLLLGSRTRQHWMAAGHLGRGARRARPPAQAARAAQLATSPVLQSAIRGRAGPAPPRRRPPGRARHLHGSRLRPAGPRRLPGTSRRRARHRPAGRPYHDRPVHDRRGGRRRPASVPAPHGAHRSPLRAGTVRQPAGASRRPRRSRAR
jgi:RNA polymerase sigma factor (sigma-70 family)